MSLINKIKNTFLNNFKCKPEIIIKSPGRINIIGEHTDYNDGFVMPAAIDKGIYIGVSKRADHRLHLYSMDFNASYSTSLTMLTFGEDLWMNYIIGVTQILNQKAAMNHGFNLVVAGNIPIGAGLSSSAALTCATTCALNKLYNLNLKKIDIAIISQQTEHEAIGVRCGIMDQFASVFGKDNNIIKLDCRSLDYEYIPIELKDYDLLLFNTNVKHSLVSSAYNKRRESCESAVALIKEKYPNVQSLRDVSIKQLDELVKNVSSEYYEKATFVLEENERLMRAAEVIKNNDIKTLGKLMYETHWALSNKYEVSCKELDFLVDTVTSFEEVVGARMMGGGFGGCTINIIKKGCGNFVFKKIRNLYFKKFNLNLTMIKVSIAEGTHQEF